MPNASDPINFAMLLLGLAALKLCQAWADQHGVTREFALEKLIDQVENKELLKAAIRMARRGH